MSELKAIQSRAGEDLDVFVETIDPQFGLGSCDFCIEYYAGQPGETGETGEIILIPERSYAYEDENKPAIVRIELWPHAIDMEEEFYWLTRLIDLNGHFSMDVNIEDGQILNWLPTIEDNCIVQFCYKTFDRGRYSLLNSDYRILNSFDGDVPNKCIPAKDGCPDYINMYISNLTGKISNWYDENEMSFEEFFVQETRLQKAKLQKARARFFKTS